MSTKGLLVGPKRNLCVNFSWEQKVPRISALMGAEPGAARGSRTKAVGCLVRPAQGLPRRGLASRRSGGQFLRLLKLQPRRPDWLARISHGCAPQLAWPAL